MTLNLSLIFIHTQLKVLKQLDIPAEKQLSLSNEDGGLERSRKPWEFIPVGHKIGTPEPLFKELVYIPLPPWHSLFCIFSSTLFLPYPFQRVL